MMRRTDPASMQANPWRGPAALPLTCRGTGFIAVDMRTWIMLALWCVGMATSQATALRLDGTPTWSITKPKCTLELVGSIRNLNAFTSGSVKMVLFADLVPFPSKAQVVAEADLGQIPGYGEIDDFKRKVNVTLPTANGDYYFTLAVLEYTLAGWQTRAYVATGQRTLKNGDFLAGYKWRIPGKKVVPPPAGLVAGDRLRLTVKANFDLDAITPGTESRKTVRIEGVSSTTVSYGGKTYDTKYDYLVAKRTLNGVKRPAGNVTLARSGNNQQAEITLFFYNATGGIYRQAAEGRVTWGVFSYD